MDPVFNVWLPNIGIIKIKLVKDVPTLSYMIMKSKNAFAQLTNPLSSKADVFHATCLITGTLTLTNVSHALHHSITIFKQEDAYVLLKDHILSIMNVLLAVYQISGMKQPKIAINVHKRLSMIHTSAAVSAQFFIHFYRMVNVLLALIQIIGTPKQIHVRIAQIPTFMTLKVGNASVLRVLHLNSMENVLHATIHTTGMKRPECALLALKHTSSIQNRKNVHVLMSYLMTLASSASIVSSQSTGTKIQRFVNSVHLAPIIHKAK